MINWRMRTPFKVMTGQQLPAGIRRLFYICILFVFFIFYFVLCVLCLNLVKKNTEADYENNCSILETIYAQNITELINRYLSDLKSFSQADILKSGSQKEIVAWFQKHDNQRPAYFLNVLYVTADGTAYLSNGLTTNVSDRDYFSEIMIKGLETTVDNGAFSKTTGKPAFHVARAVYNNKNICTGLVAASVELLTIRQILTTVKIGKRGYAFIINNSGEFISYPSGDMLLTRNNGSKTADGKETVSVILKKQTGYIDATSLTGTPVHIAFGPIAGTNWILGISIPDTETNQLYNTLRHTQIRFFAIMIAGLTLASFAGFYIVYKAQQQGWIADPYDPVTGLWNRPKFEREAHVLLRKETESSFIFIDADICAFKVLNQTYGTIITDEMLCLFSTLLKPVVSQHNGIIGRGYADRFYMLYETDPGYNALEDFKDNLARINHITRQQEYPFYTKYGITRVPPHKNNISVRDLIEQASYAKSTIQSKFINQYAVFTEDMQKKLIKDQQIENCMEKSLTAGEFFVMYQPKVSLKTEKTIGAEALVRWKNPDYGILPPDLFIPLFEKNGFVVKLDFFVYNEVFKFLQEQIDAGKQVVPVSVNMSRTHANPQQFIDDFMRIFLQYSIPPSLIEVEIVERTSDSGKYMLFELTNELHRHGFSVAMDDFGSGESSLNMLSSIPIDVIKFDQMFLRAGKITDTTKGFITKLVELGKQLNKTILFEGAETKEQVDFLKLTDCDEVQGYYYSKPLSRENFLVYLSEHI
jgi:EAL domain-containing protein (putative c-di-GMP-specific phosphodiesterase class I)/GGDEF domain-containing protein